MAPFSKEEIEKLKQEVEEKTDEKRAPQWDIIADKNLSEEELVKRLEEADIIVGEPEVAVLCRLPKVEWVQMTFAGTDKYTLNPKFPQNIKISNASGAFGSQMAEYIIGAILSNYRAFPEYAKQQKQHLWMDCLKTAGQGVEQQRLVDESLEGKTVLILGCGDIGKSTAVRLKAFGTTNIGVRRKKDTLVEGFDQVYSITETEAIEEALKQADIMIGCIPNGELTRGFLQESRLRMMKKDSVLVNVGRGSLICTEDLVRVLEDGWFRFVCLDVTQPEPLPKEHPLWKMDRVMITPHIAGPSFFHNKVTERKIRKIVGENIIRYLSQDEA